MRDPADEIGSCVVILFGTAASRWASRHSGFQMRNMTNNGSQVLSHEQRRQRILAAAEAQFAATGLASTNTAAIAKAAGVSEMLVYIHFGTKRKLFQEAIERNSHSRVACLQERFASIPDMPPLECIQSMAELTVLACVEEIGNASVTAWGLIACLHGIRALAGHPASQARNCPLGDWRQ